MAANFNEKLDFSKDLNRVGTGNVLAIKNIVSVTETECFIVNGCGHIGSIKFDSENSVILMTKFTKNKFGSNGRNLECFDVGFDVEGSKGEIYESRFIGVLNKRRLNYFVDFNVLSHNPNSGQKWPVANKEKCGKFLKILPWISIGKNENILIGLSEKGIFKVKLDEDGILKENTEKFQIPQPSLKTDNTKPMLKRNVSFSGIDQIKENDETLTPIKKSQWYSTDILFKTAELTYPEEEFINTPLSRFSIENILPENEMKDEINNNNNLSVNFFQPSFVEDYQSTISSSISSEHSEISIIRNLKNSGAIPLPGLSFKGNQAEEVLKGIEIFNERKVTEYFGEDGRFELVI